MSSDNQQPQTEDAPIDELEPCDEAHVSDLDAGAKAFLSTFSTIRSKVEDLARSESDLKRFELSIEAERKRLQKQLENSRIALKNARVQMGVELAKVDQAGFAKAAQLIKDEGNGS